MASITAAEDIREVVNLDFSLVIPQGMKYRLTPEQGSGDTCLELDNGAVRLTLDKPIAFGGKMNFDRMSDRGVVRNFAAGLFIREYGKDVAQTPILESSRIFAVCASRADSEGMMAFVLAAGKGLYRGRAILPKMTDRERVQKLTGLFASIAEYQEAPGEKPAAVPEVKKELEHIVDEPKIRSSLKPIPPAKKKVPLEELVQAAGKAEAVPEKAEAQPVKQEAVPEVKKAQPVKEKTVPDQAKEAAPEKAKTQPAQEEAAPEETKAQPAQEEAAPEETKTQPAQTEDDAQEETAAAPSSTAPQAGTPSGVNDTAGSVRDASYEERIAGLEQKHRGEIERLKEKYRGNPELEDQLDNYIAKVERTAAEITDNFRTFLRSVQEYAASARFTGPDDPSFLEMTSQIREAQNTLGGKMDELAISVDQNGQSVMAAGVTEGSVERIVRLMDRLDRKYHDFALRLNEKERLSYVRPQNISALFAKWQSVLYTLPGYIEEADRRREKAIGEDLDRRLGEARSSLQKEEAQAERFQSEASLRVQQITLADRDLERFDREYESHMNQLKQEKQQAVQKAQDKVADLERDHAQKAEHLEELRADLDKTFALNVNRKKQLSQEIEKANAEAEELSGRITAAREDVHTTEKDENRKIQALEDERQALLTRNENMKQEKEELAGKAQEAAAKASGLRDSIRSMEDEKRHLHENYLLGKYNQ